MKNRFLNSVIVVFCIVVCFVCFSSCFAEEKDRLVICSFSPELQMLIDKYYKPNHPDFDYEYVTYPIDNETYHKELINRLNGDLSLEQSDIIAFDAAYVNQIVENDNICDLSLLGFSEEDYNNVYPSVLSIGKNVDGIQKALSWSATPTALFYRASLAEKYLGVHSPEEFQEMVKDYASFLNTAKNLAKASNGECKIITGSDDLLIPNAVLGPQETDDSKLTLKKLCAGLKSSKAMQNASAWGETWYSGFRGEKVTMCYVFPSWGMRYTIMANCAPGLYLETDASKEIIEQARNTGTYGDWRVVLGPFRAFWSGTWIAANERSVNMASDGKKAAIKDLIEFLTLNEDFLMQYALDSGDMVSNSAVVSKQIETNDNSYDFLGGQDYLSVFHEAALVTPMKKIKTLIKEISIPQTEIIIQKGKTADIVFTVFPEEATNKELEWKSSDENIAKVTNGKVKAISLGECDILCTAKDGSEKQAFCRVSVIQMIQSIHSKEKRITIPYGGIYEPIIEIKPEGATNRKIAWTSTDEDVVIINEEGKFVAIGAGDCEVIGSAVDGSGKSVNFAIHVPVFESTDSEWVIDQSDWFLIPVDLHGLSPANITKKAANNKFFLSYFDEKGIHVYPIAAGTADITLISQLNKSDISKFKVTVTDSAVAKLEGESAPLKAVVVVNNPYPGYSDKVEVDYYISGGKQPYQVANMTYSQAILYCIDVPQTSQFGAPMSVDIKKFPAGSASISSYNNSGIAGKVALNVVDAEGNAVMAYANRVYPMNLGLSIVKDYWAIKRDQTINEVFKVENGTGTYNSELYWTESLNDAWKQSSSKQKSGNLLEAEFSPGYCDSVMYSFMIIDAKDKRLSAYTGENWIKMTDDVEGYITTEESYYQHVGDEIVITIHSSKDIEVENATWDLISADDKEDFEYVIEHRDMKLEKKDEQTWETRFVVEQCDYVRFNMKLTDSYLFRREFKVVK